MAYKLLDAVSAAGVSSPIWLSGAGEDHSVQVVITGGTVVVISLEGTLDNRGAASPSWFIIGQYTFDAADLAAKKVLFHVNSKVVEGIRLNLNTFTHVGQTLTAKYSPERLAA